MFGRIQESEGHKRQNNREPLRWQQQPKVDAPTMRTSKKKSFIPSQFSKYKHRDFDRVALGFAAFVVAGLGLYFTSGLRAATFSANSEAETGTLAGNASVQQQASGASGNASVLFGGIAAALAPANLQTITGGNSVAILWDMAPGAAKTEVYRNNTLVATATPGQGTVRGDKLGTRYIDKSITKGTAYQYKVRAIAANGTPSPFSAPATATPPTSTTAVPGVTINNSADPSLNDYLNTVAIPEIQTWYPKISDALAYPDYTPRNAIVLKMDATYDGIAYASGDSVVVNPAWLAANLEDGGGMFIHEVTHLLQAYPSAPGYITEGVADWTRDWFTRERPGHVSASTATLASGYSEGAAMLQWGQTKYSPDLVRKVNIAAHNGTYTDSLITGATGKNPEQLYAESKASITSGAVAVKNGNNLCLHFGSLNGDGSNTATLQTCNGTAGQQFKVVYRDTILGQRQVLQLTNPAIVPGANHCLRAAAASSNVQGWGCDFANDRSQQWQAGSNGSLINKQSGLCLTAAGGSATSGTQATSAPCDGSASQRWVLP